MAQRGANNKVTNSLLAASSAAVLAVYAAGYNRTRGASDRLELQLAGRAHKLPAPVSAKKADLPVAESQPIAAAVSATPVTTPQKIVSEEASIAPAAASTPAKAAEVPVPSAEPVAAPKSEWKDGTYAGWGASPHGDLQVSVVIEAGRISSATIIQCLTRYSCAVIDKLPPQVAQRQSHLVDAVSGATESADAFFFAVYEALGKAK